MKKIVSIILIIASLFTLSSNILSCGANLSSVCKTESILENIKKIIFKNVNFILGSNEENIKKEKIIYNCLTKNAKYYDIVSLNESFHNMDDDAFKHVLPITFGCDVGETTEQTLKELYSSHVSANVDENILRKEKIINDCLAKNAKYYDIVSLDKDLHNMDDDTFKHVLPITLGCNVGEFVEETKSSTINYFSFFVLDILNALILLTLRLEN